MKVLFIPNYSAAIPYQTLLRNALEKTGTQVTFAYDLPLKNILSRHMQWDVLHVHWTKQFFDTSGPARFYLSLFKSLARLFLIRMRGISIVWTVHNLVSHDSRYRKSELLFSGFLITLAKGIIIHSVLCKEQFLREYHGLGRRKVTVIPIGHLIGVYDNSVSREEARLRLGLSPGDKVFLSLGHVRPYKGLQGCVALFKNIDDPSARLLIVGKPITDAFAQELQRDCMPDPRIRCVLTFVPDHDIQLYLNAADLMILPFQQIFTSASLILAMSFSKAIVAPKTGAIPDYVDASGAFLYDPEAPDGLPNAMRAAMERYSELPSMGRANFERVKSLDWNSIGVSTAAIYNGS
jgi:beta-1,4-mannosyltransferase